MRTENKLYSLCITPVPICEFVPLVQRAQIEPQNNQGNIYTHRRQQVQGVGHRGRPLVQEVPRRELARVCGETTLQVGANIARWS